jgi:hypothetical protein
MSVGALWAGSPCSPSEGLTERSIGCPLATVREDPRTGLHQPSVGPAAIVFGLAPRTRNRSGPPVYPAGSVERPLGGGSNRKVIGCSRQPRLERRPVLPVEISSRQQGHRRRCWPYVAVAAGARSVTKYPFTPWLQWHPARRLRLLPIGPVSCLSLLRQRPWVWLQPLPLGCGLAVPAIVLTVHKVRGIGILRSSIV